MRESYLDLWVGVGFVIKRGKRHRVHFGILRNFLVSKNVIFRHLLHYDTAKQKKLNKRLLRGIKDDMSRSNQF